SAASPRVAGQGLGRPQSFVGNGDADGKSGFAEVGAGEFPKAWEELGRVAGALKTKGHPYGQPLGHTFGDAPTFTYPLLWSFGGADTDRTGRTVVLGGAPGTDSAAFLQTLWK